LIWFKAGANYPVEPRGRLSQAGHLHITFKEYKFNNMNVMDLMPAAESAAALMRSLSHPQRLLVLCALVDGEKSVAELRQGLGIVQVPMSQQLMRLRSDGLVEARREGSAVYYSIARPEVLTVVDALHSAFCAPAGGKPREPSPRMRRGSKIGHSRFR
jgi:DNA-binding transcriptional ArsR family regulator